MIDNNLMHHIEFFFILVDKARFLCSIQSQQLARIYSLLRENQDQLGDLSIDDVKKQMAMYTPSQQ